MTTAAAGRPAGTSEKWFSSTYSTNDGLILAITLSSVADLGFFFGGGGGDLGNPTTTDGARAYGENFMQL